MGHHDKAAVSISSDNSESILIRDIPAPVSLHNINGKMMCEIVLMYGQCEDRSNSIWTGSGHISNPGAEDLQITPRAVCAGSFRLFILDIALVGCLRHT